MRNWATVNRKVVRQRSNRQQTTMAAASTLPISMYEIEKTENINHVEVVFFLQVLQTFQLPPYLFKSIELKQHRKIVFDILPN